MKLKLDGYIKQYSVRNKKNENIPVYSVTNTQGFCRDYFGKEVASKDKTTYKIVPKGYFAYNPSRIDVGSVDWQRYEDRVIVSPLYNVFSLSDEIDKQFFYYYIKSDITIQKIRFVSIGSVRNNLKLDMLKEFFIDLPPIQEQIKIVKILDNVCNLINKYQKEIAQLDLLIKSRFIEMFGTNDNEYRFSDCVLGDKIIVLSDFSANGSYEKLDSNVKMYDQPNYAWMVRTTDLESQDISNIKYIDKNSYNLLSKSRLYGNELIMCKIGSAGKMYLMPKIDKPASLGRNAFLMRFNEQDVNMIYLFTYLNTTPLQKEIQKRVKGAVTKTITKDDVRSIPLILPPIELQNQFAEFVEKTDKIKQTIKSNLEKLETLKKSLMQQYFG